MTIITNYSDIKNLCVDFRYSKRNFFHKYVDFEYLNIYKFLNKCLSVDFFHYAGVLFQLNYEIISVLRRPTCTNINIKIKYTKQSIKFI